jgi:hypothetical protein
MLGALAISQLLLHVGLKPHEIKAFDYGLSGVCIRLSFG